LDGGPVFTVTQTNPTFGSTPTPGGNGQVQPNVTVPTTGSLISSASGAAFFSASIAGGGSITATAITNGNVWDPSDGPYTVTFSSSADWSVTNGADTQIASGTGSVVTFRAISITVSAPVNGTTITVTAKFA